MSLFGIIIREESGNMYSQGHHFKKFKPRRLSVVCFENITYKRNSIRNWEIDEQLGRNEQNYT